MSEQLEKITVWYSVRNCGDGSAYPYWFLTEEEADKDQENQDDTWSESCVGSVQTFVGSDIHQRAELKVKLKQKLNLVASYIVGSNDNDYSYRVLIDDDVYTISYSEYNGEVSVSRIDPSYKEIFKDSLEKNKSYSRDQILEFVGITIASN